MNTIQLTIFYYRRQYKVRIFINLFSQQIDNITFRDVINCMFLTSQVFPVYKHEVAKALSPLHKYMEMEVYQYIWTLLGTYMYM